MNAKLFNASLVTAFLLVTAGHANAQAYKLIFLDSLEGSSQVGANGINDSGQVVGYSSTSGWPTLHAVIWNGTAPTDLGTLWGYASYAYAINNSGQVVGDVSGPSPTSGYPTNQATIWNGTTGTDLGTLPGGAPSASHSYALGINNAGQVVGWSTTNTGEHATIWNGTTPTDLGTLPGGHDSVATAINNLGQVVGYSYTSGGHAEHATLWDHGTKIDLNTFLDNATRSAGWVLSIAHGINDSGWIVGDTGNTLHGGEAHAFLLIPVPEPETYAMFMAGLGLMGFIARRRKNGQA